MCGEDEDAVSMGLTATQRLLDGNDVQATEVGDVRVASASLLDRSKSLKTELMALFESRSEASAEGTDLCVTSSQIIAPG